MKIAAFTKTYGGRTVLDFPGVELEPGKIYAVIGANGSGKSTFAKILTGIESSDQKKKPLAGVDVGYMGQVHPLVAKNYDLDCEVFCVEIDFDRLYELRLPDATYTPLPKYPGVTRDLSLICDEAITVAQAEDVITAAAGKLLRSVRLFDIYRGTGVPEGKKSMAFALELRADDRTLTDADSEGVIQKVLTALKEQLNATLR